MEPSAQPAIDPQLPCLIAMGVVHTRQQGTFMLKAQNTDAVENSTNSQMCDSDNGTFY